MTIKKNRKFFEYQRHLMKDWYFWGVVLFLVGGVGLIRTIIGGPVHVWLPAILTVAARMGISAIDYPRYRRTGRVMGSSNMIEDSASLKTK